MSDVIDIVTIAIATDGSGDFTIDTPHVRGRLLQTRYLFGTLAATADITLVGAVTGKSYLNLTDQAAADADINPRQSIHDTAGVESLYAATFPVEDYIWINEPLTFTIAQGGTSVAGTMYLWVG